MHKSDGHRPTLIAMFNPRISSPVQDCKTTDASDESEQEEFTWHL